MVGKGFKPPSPYKAGDQHRPPSTNNQENHLIRIYTSTNCAGCNQAKAHLDKLGFAYEAIDVTKDEEAKERLRSLNLRSVPQVFVNSIHLGGLHSLIKLDAPALQNLLGT